MASRTYMVGLKLALKGITKFVNRYETKIRENAGEGLWPVIQFLLALVEVALQILEANADSFGNYDGPISGLSSEYINQVNGAIAGWNAAVEDMD
jgi:hypothetical protein